MITTDRFVFLHLHKSGGTFVNECLMRHLPDARHVGYHLPRSMIPPDKAGLPVLGFVRNPWSYYVSWYFFQKQRPRPNALFQILSDQGTLNFDQTLRNMLNLGAGSVRLDLLIRALPAQYSNQGLNLPGFALAPIRGTQLGFYGYLYRYLYGDGMQPALIGRLESLREDLLVMLDECGQPVSAAMRTQIEEQAPSNQSTHDRYTHYYSDALRELVAQREAVLISRHGYVFGG